MSIRITKKIVIIATVIITVISVLANLIQVWDWFPGFVQGLFERIGLQETSVWLETLILLAILLIIGACAVVILKYSKADTPQSASTSSNPTHSTRDAILDKDQSQDSFKQTTYQPPIQGQEQLDRRENVPPLTNIRDNLIELLRGSNYVSSEDARLALCGLIEFEPPSYIGAGAKIFCQRLVQELWSRDDITRLMKIVQHIETEYKNTLRYEMWHDTYEELTRIGKSGSTER